MDTDIFLGLLFAVLVWVLVCVLLSDEERIERFRKWFLFARYPRFSGKKGKSSRR